MERREPPATKAGYYVLHDFRRIDWESWEAAGEATQEAVLTKTESFLAAASEEDGDIGIYSVLGHKADFLLLALRPSMDALDTLERSFHRSPLAAYTERTTSAVGVTEASGYTEAAAEYFDPEAEADAGIERYMNARLYPNLPEAEFISFYFMDKRRGETDNWYDMPYDERAEHVTSHGEIGKQYAGKVTQMITGTMGFDDWEWGVTLFSNDMVEIKDLLMEMRFDPSTSRFAEFGPFYVGRRFPPTDLPAFFAGESIPTESETADTEADTAILDALAPLSLDVEAGSSVAVAYSDETEAEVGETLDGLRDNFDHYDSHLGTVVTTDDDETVIVSAWSTERAVSTAAGFIEDLPGVTDVITGKVGDGDSTQQASTSDETAESVRSTLEAAGVYSGQPHGEDLHALILYSEADTESLVGSVSELSSGFDRYDTHVETTVYATEEAERTAVVSLWETADAAETAADYLADLPAVLTETDSDGFATMGMFYQVKPDYRTEFVETFQEVGGLLEEMEGHRTTELFANAADPNDMFIASRWDDKEAAMAFFRSDAFRDTVQWGREVLDGRPRHVFFV